MGIKKTKTIYDKVVKKYLNRAFKYYEQCGVIPDGEDIAGCIYDFWENDVSSGLNEDDYQGLIKVLIDVEEKEEMEHAN